MNGCYHYLLLLSLLSSLEKTISINLPNVTIQHVCEHDLLFIKCSNKNESIQIVRSMYGRTSQRICNYDLTNQIFYKTCANIEQSKNQTKLRCQRKSTCQVLIDNTIYNDPCEINTPKHFEIHYRCINFDDICLKLFQTCSLSKDLKCIEKVQDEYSCQCPSNICEYDPNRNLIGFVEHSCRPDNFQGVHWPKTLVNKGQHVSCPYPCTGQIFRFCQTNNQWSKPNYTNCQCSIKTLDSLSMHHFAHSYVFQCNFFWLINRLLPRDKTCTFETNEYSGDDSVTCLLNAFEKMSTTSCTSFSIDFKNIGFEVFLPVANQRRIRLPRITSDLNAQYLGSNRILLDKFDDSYGNLPMMFIDTKNFNSIAKSLIVVEQSNNLTSRQTANVTVIFNQPSSELRYQCRGYRSNNSAFLIDSSDIYFTCQLLCSNGSHVICQCPFYHPFMHYTLQVDNSISEDSYELNMIDNDLKDKCSIDSVDKTMERMLNKIDSHLNKLSSFLSRKILAKKLLSFMNSLIDDENEWLFRSFDSKWYFTIRLIRQVESIGLHLSTTTNSFVSVHKHIELFINPHELEDHNQFVWISADHKKNSSFFVLSKLHQYLNSNQSVTKLNSHIVSFNATQIEHVRITFRHLYPLNSSNQVSICVYLKNIDNMTHVQWSTDGCYLVSSNSTHSICSCNHLSTFAILMDTRLILEKSITNSKVSRLRFLSNIGYATSISCLVLTIIVLLMRRRLNFNDNLIIIRNILHINMSICLLVSQVLYLIHTNELQHQLGCRTITILTHYFLLASYSWMFVDGIELFVALKHSLKFDRIRILAYSLYAYGFPLLIVILSLILSTQERSANKQRCWFSYDNGFIWAFAIPFVLLIITNFGLFIISIVKICQRRKSSTSAKDIKYFLRDITILSILLGFIWLFSLFHYDEQNFVIISYILTILKSFQGLFIFIFICLSKSQIRNCHIHEIFNVYLKKSKSEEKSNQNYNTSSSGYSSAHSSDSHKQITSMEHQKSFRPNAEYLSSMPIGLLSTFRYPTATITVEQNEQLLKKYKFDFSHQQDDHQYYEIG